MMELAVENSTTAMTRERLGLATMIVTSGMICTLVMAALLGNLLIIVAVSYCKKLRASITNCFVVSLAASDLLVAILVMPTAATRDVGRVWWFGSIGCSIFTSLDILGCTASIMNLCVVSLDRYLAISDPLHYSTKMTRNRAIALIMAAWAVSLLISFLPVNLNWHLLQPHNPPTDCALVLNTVYALISSCISFYIPASLIIFANTRIFFIARNATREQMDRARSVSTASRHKNSNYSTENVPSSNNNNTLDENLPKKVKANSLHQPILESPTKKGRSVSCPTAPNLTGRVSLAERTRRLHSRLSASRLPDEPDTPLLALTRRLCCCCCAASFTRSTEHKATITIGIIVGTFLLCWTPFFVCNVLLPFVPFDARIFVIVTWVGYLNSCLNPIILYNFNRDYKTAFIDVLKMRRRNSGTSIPLDTPC